MQVSSAGLLFTGRFEGYRSEKYWDPYGKVWTIGFGTTTSVVNPMPATCTMAQALNWLKEYDERGVEPYLADAFAAARAGGSKWESNQNQWDALVDLGYNCGGGVFSSRWAMGRAIRSGSPDAVYAAFTNYEFSGGVKLPGLVTRREAEQKLFSTPAPKPDPYLVYPDERFTFNGLSFNERSLARTLDLALERPRLRRATLRAYLPHAEAAADRLVAIDKPKWTPERREREELWQKRIAAIQKVLA